MVVVVSIVGEAPLAVGADAAAQPIVHAAEVADSGTEVEEDVVALVIEAAGVAAPVDSIEAVVVALEGGVVDLAGVPRLGGAFRCLRADHGLTVHAAYLRQMNQQMWTSGF